MAKTESNKSVTLAAGQQERQRVSFMSLHFTEFFQELALGFLAFGQARLGHRSDSKAKQAYAGLTWISNTKTMKLIDCSWLFFSSVHLLRIDVQASLSMYIWSYSHNGGHR